MKKTGRCPMDERTAMASNPVHLKVADQIASTLRRYGVQYAFGIPGNDVLEIVRACEECGIRFVLGKSEPSCAFMADAVWQLTGRPAVLITALGPGLANAISGIAGALQERTALVVISGEMTTANQGLYSHQALDHVALARPVTKYAERLNPRRAAQQTAKALDIALSHPAGPVLLNVAADHGRAPSPDDDQHRPIPFSPLVLAPDAVDSLRAILDGARRPLALVGHGAVNRAKTAQAVRLFTEARHLPVLTTYRAKGVVDERGPLSLGAVGLSPIMDALSAERVSEADLLILIGFDPIELRDTWLDAWPHSKPVISIDQGPLNHRMLPIGQAAYGDVPSILGQLMPCGPRVASGWSRKEIAAHRAKIAAIVKPREPAGRISPAALFHAVDRRLARNWLLTADVGAHRILANHVIRCRQPGQLLQSNGLGCMGYSLAAAIASQLVFPQRPVLALVGDGGLLMSLGELATAAKHNLPLIVVVLNDASLSLIGLKQAKAGLAARATDFASPRFDGIAAGFGAHGVRVGSLAEFETALDEALAASKLTLIDALIDPREYREQM